nr:MAG TPA: hypothetical protein [Caudoviricetes sp.]
MATPSQKQEKAYPSLSGKTVWKIRQLITKITAAIIQGAYFIRYYLIKTVSLSEF